MVTNQIISVKITIFLSFQSTYPALSETIFSFSFSNLFLLTLLGPLCLIIIGISYARTKIHSPRLIEYFAEILTASFMFVILAASIILILHVPIR